MQLRSASVRYFWHLLHACLVCLINKYFCRGTEKTIKTQIMKSNEHKGSEPSSSSSRGRRAEERREGAAAGRGGEEAAAAGNCLPQSVFTLPSSRWNAVAAHFTSRYFSIGKSLHTNVGGVLFLEVPMGGGGGERVYLQLKRSIILG